MKLLKKRFSVVMIDFKEHTEIKVIKRFYTLKGAVKYLYDLDSKPLPDYADYIVMEER